MSIEIIPTIELPGTKVILIKNNPGNPARFASDLHLFRKGYWEVHVSSTGEHPDFLKGNWKILFVRLTQQEVSFEIPPDQGLYFIPVAPMVRPEAIEIAIECIEIEGYWWQFPLIIITLSGQRECKIQCDEAQMLESMSNH